MSYNVPDDWDNYWINCECGRRFHASENYCDHCEQREQAERDANACEAHSGEYDYECNECEQSYRNSQQ